MSSEARHIRNQNPHKAAVAAMFLYGSEYSRQGGGSMDFWDSLSDSRKNLCREMVSKIENARKEFKVE